MFDGDFTIELGDGHDCTLVRKDGKYLCYYNGEPCEPMKWHKDQIAAIEAAPTGKWHHIKGTISEAKGAPGAKYTGTLADPTEPYPED